MNDKKVDIITKIRAEFKATFNSPAFTTKMMVDRISGHEGARRLAK